MRASREKASAAVRVRRPVRGTLPSAVDAALAAPGKPLDIAVRREMERRFGHDFGDVRVHADMQASTAARLLDADAFTSGRDIVFGDGRYQPDDEPGRWLIAHELVHTLQQGGGAAIALQVSTRDTDPLEREADSVATRVVAGDMLPAGAVSVGAPTARGRIARRARAALERLPAEVPDSPEAVLALADEIARLLAAEPGDRFGRAKRRLACLAEATRAAVATALGGRIPATAAARLRGILAELLPPGASEPTVEAPLEPPSSEPDEQSAVSDEPLAEDTKQSAASAEGVAPESAPSPAELEAAGVQEDLLAPGVESEGPVAEPELQAVVVSPEPEAAPAAVEQRQRVSRARAGGPAPAPETAEAAGPEEDAADPGPVDDTEAETLVADDETDAEPADAGDEEVGRELAGAQVEVDPEPEPATAEAEAEEEAADPIAEESGDGDDPGGPVADPEHPISGAPPAEPEEPEPTELVADKPPDAPEPGIEEPGAESSDPPAAALADQGPEDAVEIADTTPAAGDEEAEPEEPAAPEMAEEGSAIDEHAAAGHGGAEAAAPIEDPAEPETPDLSAADPAAAMEAAATLPPAQSEAALTGVDAAASRSVAAQREALADQPPELARPTGAPTAEELAAEAAATEAPRAPAPLQRAPEPPTSAATRIEPLPPAPPPVAARARAPQLAGGPQGELNEDGRRALLASLNALPIHDSALDVSAGTAPAVTLDGAADPQRAHMERDKLETVARSGLAEGRREIVKPAGEQRLVPQVPVEQLRAAIPTTPNAESNTAPPAADPLATDTASILAREKRGDELRAAAKDAAAGMRTKKAEQAATTQEERRRSQEQVTQLVRDSAAQQTERRADARGEVHTERQRWSTAEHELAEGQLRDADTKLTTGIDEVARLKTDADQLAATHIETGEREADTARREGETQAAAERKRGEEKSSGVLGWLADKATALFDEIKAGITKAFEIARAAVRTAIETAKRLAAAAIDRARDAIVAAIRLAADAMIAIGDELLAAFPGVRDRFRRAIEERVAKAQAVVNALADDLKTAVQKALDGLGAALDAALGLLEKGLLLIVDGYRAVVAGALKWADGIVKGFAAFAVLVEHVAANPKQWLRNLAASAKDGVKNHLWKAFSAAIKTWFWEKVEEVLGLGLTIWNLLKKGGLSLARIGTMAWEAIKAAIPPTLIQILIEKLISLLIPAAAAVMLIIETLQAAWGTIQRVLEAFERFFEFLKAVRTGKAGPHFARAIAAAAVAVIDFVANWLLKRLRKPAGKIAKKLKALARKFGKRIARFGKGLFKKRRKKPKLTGKPKKRSKPDKKAQADKRVAAATNFVVKQLTRGLWEPVLWLQMKYARVRWRVHIHFRVRDDTGEMTISGSPAKKQKVKDKRKKKRPAYSAAIRRYQGFLRAYHHRHHLLSGGVREWWDAADLNWNDPIYFLDIPALLHLRSLHRTLGKLDAAKAKTISRRFRRKLRDQWNSYWQVWLDARLPKWVKVNPTRKALAKAVRAPGSTLRARVQREITVTGVNELLTEFSARSGVPLRKYRVKGYSMQKHFEYLAQLTELENDLKKAKKKDHDKVIRDWQIRILGGLKKLSKAQRKWWPS